MNIDEISIGDRILFRIDKVKDGFHWINGLVQDKPCGVLQIALLQDNGRPVWYDPEEIEIKIVPTLKLVK